jgi:hypothetical protein
MRLKIPFILFFFLIILSGCPYESETTLCCYKGPIDNSLIGNWKTLNPDGSPPAYYSFSRTDDYNYLIIQEIYHSTNKRYDKTIFTGFLTTVNNVKFLQFDHSTEKKVLIAKYSTLSNNLYLSFVSDKCFTINEDKTPYTFTFSSSQEFTKHFKALMNYPSFYEEEVRLSRY